MSVLLEKNDHLHLLLRYNEKRKTAIMRTVGREGVYLNELGMHFLLLSVSLTV